MRRQFGVVGVAEANWGDGMVILVRVGLWLGCVVAAFGCSRGADGAWLGTWVAGAAIAVAAAVGLGIARVKTVRAATMEAAYLPFLCAGGGVLGVLPGSRLEEMAGALYLVIPGVLFAAVLLGTGIQWVVCFRASRQGAGTRGE